MESWDVYIIPPAPKAHGSLVAQAGLVLLILLLLPLGYWDYRGVLTHKFRNPMFMMFGSYPLLHYIWFILLLWPLWEWSGEVPWLVWFDLRQSIRAGLEFTILFSQASYVLGL